MLLDRGGARIRDIERTQKQAVDDFVARLERDRPAREAEIAKHKAKADKAQARVKKAPSIRVKVEETHDGDACECITKELTVEVGQTIELEHVCHDGRVDIVRATVLSIDD